MPLADLVPGQNPAAFGVQQTAFSYDVLGRYTCTSWDEVAAAQASGGYPFDAIVIGAGMFGGYLAEKLYRAGGADALRILVLDAGALLFATHVQNLPQRLGGPIGGASLRKRDDGTQNVIWGMPWISNQGFPGLAYCIGGRSLFWGGWSPRLTKDDLARWPSELKSYLTGTTGNDGAYRQTEVEIGVQPSTDFIVKASLYRALFNRIEGVVSPTATLTGVTEAPLAVQGSAPGSGLFSFDKFSSVPFLLDAIRDDVANDFGRGDIGRRLFVVPRAEVRQLNVQNRRVTRIDVTVNGIPQSLSVDPRCAVVLANGTIEATRLALGGLGVGSTMFGAPRAGNLMAHLRSNIVVRIKRAALGLATPAPDLETTALLVRGQVGGRQFHIQLTSSAAVGADSEKNMWSMVPDIDLQASMVKNQDPNWVSVTLRSIGEMEDHRALEPDAKASWVDLSGENDQFGARRAYVQLVPTANDLALWTAMDRAAFDLALKIAGDPKSLEYWNKATNAWQTDPPKPDASGGGFWRDGLGTTHHEAGPLYMGGPGAGVTDLEGRFQNCANAYVAGPALFPTLGSANPSLTALSLARRTVGAIMRGATSAPDPAFTPLSLDPADWQMVRLAGTAASMRHYGALLETNDAYGLYWYRKEAFADFVLKLEWRVARLDDNSGVYIRVPEPTVPNALQAADQQGHEIQIDEQGWDSATQTAGHPLKRTGALYDLQAPTAFPSASIGSWNEYVIEASGPTIKVTLNQQLVNTFVSDRRRSGYIALQAHHFTSRVQFRNLQVKRL
jgi:choline dehydrogenase-like flavoprotein